MSRIKNIFSRFKRDASGIAAVEFALSAPILIALCFGGYEMSRHVIVEMKMEKVAFTLADVISQNETLTNAQISDVFNAASQIAQPTTIGSSGIAYITSAYRGTGEAYPTVIWQRSGAGTAAIASQVGSVGLTATLPNGLTINERDNVIVVELFYQYTPTFSLGIFGATTMRKTSVFKPRLGDLTTSPT